MERFIFLIIIECTWIERDVIGFFFDLDRAKNIINERKEIDELDYLNEVKEYIIKIERVREGIKKEPEVIFSKKYIKHIEQKVSWIPQGDNPLKSL